MLQALASSLIGRGVQALKEPKALEASPVITQESAPLIHVLITLKLAVPLQHGVTQLRDGTLLTLLLFLRAIQDIEGGMSLERLREKVINTQHRVSFGEVKKEQIREKDEDGRAESGSILHLTLPGEIFQSITVQVMLNPGVRLSKFYVWPQAPAC